MRFLIEFLLWQLFVIYVFTIKSKNVAFLTMTSRFLAKINFKVKNEHFSPAHSTPELLVCKVQ